MNQKIQTLQQEITQFENLILRGRNEIENKKGEITEIETKNRKAELEIVFRQGRIAQIRDDHEDSVPTINPSTQQN